MDRHHLSVINVKFTGPGFAMAVILLCVPVLAFSAGELAARGPFARSAHAPVDEAFESVTSGKNMKKNQCSKYKTEYCQRH